MQKINSASDLKKIIKELEEKQKGQGKVLKESFLEVYESFRLINIVKGYFKDLSLGLQTKNGILSSVLGFAGTCIFKNKTKNNNTDEDKNNNSGVFSRVAENIITGYLLKKPTTFKIFGILILKYLFSKSKI